NNVTRPNGNGHERTEACAILPTPTPAGNAGGGIGHGGGGERIIAAAACAGGAGGDFLAPHNDLHPGPIDALRQLAMAAAAEAAAEADGDGDGGGDGDGETDVDTDVELEAATAERVQQWSDGTAPRRASDDSKCAQRSAAAAAADGVAGLPSTQIMRIFDPQDPNLAILTAALKVAATVSPDAVREMVQYFPTPAAAAADP
ncbi:hypothetical protein Vretifemale_924, partial [Volvox reticuliferus]